MPKPNTARKPAASIADASAAGAGGRSRWPLILAIIAAAIVLAEVWLVARQNGDLYMALAGGRDAAGGKLGSADDWAFTTHGRVWINQNWLTGLLYYGVWKAAGDSGLLALKAAMMLAAAACVTMAGRQRGASWLASVLAAAGAMAVSASYIDLRPNLTTLVFAPLLLWLLYLSRRRPHAAWAAAAVAGLWANMHGGFIYGLAVMALWAACLLGAAILRKQLPAAMKAYWPLPAATAAAVLLAGLANPFGLTNLTHPFVVANNPAWRTISEWQPIFGAAGGDFGSTWEFLTLLAAMALLLIAQLASRREGKRATARPPTGIDAATAAFARSGGVAFDILLSLAVTAMAFSARRFIPLAAVVLAPLLAGLLHRVLLAGPRARAAWALSAGAMLLAAACAWPAVRTYLPTNPVYPPETMAQRMVGLEAFPAGAAQFINANGLAGRVLNEWKWEGFLHWHCPQLKLFVGGRAQQVYDIETELLRRQIATGRSSPAATLAAMDVHLAIVPQEYEALLAAMVDAPLATWAYIYCDSNAAVLADASWPQTKAMVEAAAAGRLQYPDEASARLSRAMCLYSPASRSDGLAAAEALEAAALAKPTVTAYATLGNMALSGRHSPQRLAEFLQRQQAALAAMPTMQPSGLQTLECRRTIAQMQAVLLAMAGRTDQARQAEQEAARLGKQVEETAARWR